VTDKNKPVLDEQSFGKLLEASYVIQEHHRKLRDLEAIVEAERRRDQESVDQAPLPKSKSESEESNGDYILTLAQIVEAQRQIQTHHLDLEKTMAVVAESVARITRASGAGIGILDEKKVRYLAGTGTAALPAGSEVPLKVAICAASVRTGQAIRSEDIDTEVLFDPEPCRQRGIRSLVAVPIYQDGGIVGGLELYFDRIHGYGEQDIHTCQLMAGLVTEALGREADRNVKKSMAAERSSMLAEIEKLQPNSAASKAGLVVDAATIAGAGAAAAKSLCQKCGSTLMAEELFCGKCGTPRASADEASHVPWDMERVHSEHAALEENVAADDAAAAIFLPVEEGESFPGHSLAMSEREGAVKLSSDLAAAEETLPEKNIEEVETLEDGNQVPSTALARTRKDDVVWSSAARAREFLESLSGGRSPGALARFWRSRRGDFYLAFAVILVVAVIRWGIWSDHTTVAGSGTPVSRSANRRKPAPDANLSAFDKFLIGLGLADPPDEAPEYKGNPDTQVWVDLHTALYYCPGSDLYGKTPKGKLASQRDAQLDQFEPAYRKACD
jgi:putative methionine-R-sulfoxide reductase with GAF domain